MRSAVTGGARAVGRLTPHRIRWLATVFCWMLLGLLSSGRAEEESQTALRLRESLCSQLRGRVIHRVTPGPDWIAYSEAEYQAHQALRDFLGKPRSRAKLHESHQQQLAPLSYGLTWDAERGGWAFRESLEAGDVFRRCCVWDSSRWLIQVPLSGDTTRATVFIDERLDAPPLLQAAGLHGSLVSVTGTGMASQIESSYPLSMYLERVEHARGLNGATHELGSQGGPVLVLDYIEPTSTIQRLVSPGERTAPHPAATSMNVNDLRRFVGHAIRLELDCAHGYMPRRAEGRLVAWSDGEGWKETLPPQRWTIRWLDPTEVTEGLWLPAGCVIDLQLGVMEPESDGFRAIDTTTRPEPIRGLRLPDIHATTTKLFHVRRAEFAFMDWTLESGDAAPLCAPDFPAGTVVEDRLIHEVYELTEAGPAVNPRGKRVLDVTPVLAPLVIRNDEFPAVPLLFMVNGAFALLALGLYVRRRFRRTSDVDAKRSGESERMP